MLTTAQRVAFGAGLFVGVLLGIPAGAAIAPAESAPIQEDDPGWDCRSMGDRVCGPTNVQGVPAGLYRGGQLVAVWDPAWFGRPELVPAL